MNRVVLGAEPAAAAQPNRTHRERLAHQPIGRDSPITGHSASVPDHQALRQRVAEGEKTADTARALLRSSTGQFSLD